ncbi:5'-3' exonuclease [Catenulispora acidiphila DSM 44928]|uniref:5'-3' exonuclease n=2 Tax=Catenulispora TaxID=414878 RepID=C7PVW9_CATAD|nr:5'-3' exonuclease [Catenulispora acidiphila]ACU71361.1 5'-3' exonuclease [Catenulispora acidiphila DSM 44928]
MAKNPERLMVLDTPTLYFRAFFGVPDTIRSPDGMVVNAVRGTVESVSYLINTYKPDRLVACFDADWRPAFRVEAIPSYKAHRVLEEAPAGGAGVDVEEVPDLLSPQVPVIEAALDALGIARAEAPGFEADDVLATLAERWDGRGPVDVVTMDRDLYQLVDDTREIRVLNIGKGVTKLEVVTDQILREKYGITGGEYADFAALRGDPSDGLPGVSGIGEKTAAALISQYKDLAGVRAAAEDPASTLKPAQRKRIAEAAGYLDAAPTVVRVVRDAPVVEHDDRLPREPKDPIMAAMLAEKFGVKTAVARLTRVMAER